MADKPKDATSECFEKLTQTDIEYWTAFFKRLGIHPLTLLGYDTSYLRDETKQQVLMDMDPPSKYVH